MLHQGKPCTGPAPLKCLRCAGDFYGVPKGWQAVAGVAASKRLTARRIAALQSVSSFVDDVTSRNLLGSGARHAAVPRTVVPAFVAPEPSPTEADERQVSAILAQLPDEPFILFVGALRPLKGVDVLFEAYRRLERPPPLVLLGTIERDTPHPFPAGATVLTDVPHRAVMAVWSRALLGVAPSVWPEPLGTVAIEGITRGVPMIATVPSGMVDVLGGGVGILVEQGDAAGLAEAMRSLIADPDLRAALSQAGPARAAAFEPELVLTRYEEMLERVVARR
jgi:glycosyltransferase involved in cell wall biosynthesis